MSSFARASFDVAGYLSCRPSYPSRVIDIILQYHTLTGGRFKRALDLGCGPGFVALALSPHFEHTLALDPAQKMVDIGIQPDKGPRIEYAVGSAEDIGSRGVGEGEEGVDLVVAGQAAHWFDHAKTWEQLARRVRPGGTVAYLGYAEMIFPNHPHLSPIISEHSRSFWKGGYWQSGRRIVENLLDQVPFPVQVSQQSIESQQSLLARLPPLESNAASPLKSQAHPHPTSDNIANAPPASLSEECVSAWDPTTAVRLKADTVDAAVLPGETGAGGSENRQWLMRKTFTRHALEGYLRTWSALHAYHEAHPEDAAKRGTEGGDVVDRTVKRIWDERERDGALGGEGEKEIEGAWPLVLMMVKRKQ